MQRRITVRALIVHEEKLLLLRLRTRDGGVTPYWATPGGGVDDGEPLLDALNRELIEELGVAPQIGNLLFVQQFQHKGYEQLEFFFLILNSQDYLNVDLSKTSHGALEIADMQFMSPAETDTLLPEFLRSAKYGNSQQTQFYSYL